MIADDRRWNMSFGVDGAQNKVLDNLHTAAALDSPDHGARDMSDGCFRRTLRKAAEAYIRATLSPQLSYHIR